MQFSFTAAKCDTIKPFWIEKKKMVGTVTFLYGLYHFPRGVAAPEGNGTVCVAKVAVFYLYPSSITFEDLKQRRERYSSFTLYPQGSTSCI